MTSFHLHIIAMAAMLCDHLGRTIMTEMVWLTYLGRIAFPIYAFLLTEGLRHTRDVERYMMRLLLFALISEIPFDLMLYGMPCFWSHQNCLWTLLLGLLSLHLADSIQNHEKDTVVSGVAVFLTVFFTSITAGLLSLDYGHFGILQIWLFSFFRKKRQHSPLYLLLGTTLLNVLPVSEPFLPFPTLLIPAQTLATFSLVPIRFYNGKPGYQSKSWKLLCYFFCPLHMVILAVL